MEALSEAAAPPAALTAAMMAERASSMFSLDATGPVATGMPKIAEAATMELVNLAFGAVGKVCDQHGKVLSRAFGNFDRVVGLGWLVTDALGRVSAHEIHVGRLWQRVELLSELPRRSFKQLQQCSRRTREHDKARNTLHIMELRQKDAMIAYLEAQLGLSDAWMDEKDLDMEQYMAEMDAVHASGSEA